MAVFLALTSGACQASLPSGPVVMPLDEVLYGAPMGVGTLELGEVGDADLLRDSRMVVLDRLAARVCLFTRTEPGGRGGPRGVQWHTDAGRSPSGGRRQGVPWIRRR